MFTFGYGTHVRHALFNPPNTSTVYDIARNFLILLDAERQTASARPILFVVHSLRGIMVKEALRQSYSSKDTKGRSHLYNIHESCSAIVFFGTPHRGADPRGMLHHVFELLIKAVGFSANSEVANTLLPSADRLKELREWFGPMARKREWMIHSFQEELGVRALNGKKVVVSQPASLE